MLFGEILDELLLEESASVENVTRAMDNHSKVIINYQTKGENLHNGSRVIEPVAYGLTKAGNPVIRAYQPYGDTTSKVPSWKFFRLDRITYWEETGQKFSDVPDYVENLNSEGDNTMSVVIKNYNSTLRNSDTKKDLNGPKTKTDVYKTVGDRTVDLGKRNLERLKNPIKIDLDNRNKITTTPQQKTKGIQNMDGEQTPDLTVGPKTKTDVYKTAGDRQLELGRQNLQRMQQNNS